MEEIYVDNVPKDCKSCGMLYENSKGKTVCVFSGYETSINGKSKKCFLRDIKDHDAEKDKQIAVLERALSMACERLYDEYGCYELDFNINKPINESILVWTNYYKNQATAEIEKEKRDGSN